jgi:hypothetical protein
MDPACDGNFLVGMIGSQFATGMSFVHDAPPMMAYRQNKSPFAIALGDWFPFRTYYLTSKASPNDSEIVIIVRIIVIGEAQLVLHMGGIIAQTAYLDRVSFHYTKGCKAKATIFVEDVVTQ